MGRISLTAFFPAYNDEHTIEKIVRTAAQEMRKVTDDFEVLVVNDGSQDSTDKILDDLCKELPFLRVIVDRQRISRYGILILVAMMWFLPNSLSTLMTPATKTFSWTLDKIEGSTLPSTRQWLIR